MRAAEVALTSEQQATLRSWVTAGKTERRLAFRAQIILALAEGLSNAAVAGRLATRPATVSKWRGCFARQGLAGLADAARAWDFAGAAAQLVHQYRSGVHAESRRHRRALPAAARESRGLGGR